MGTLRSILVTAALALTSVPLRAHHVTSVDFDVSRLIVLKGVIRKVEWINPHAWLHLDVRDAKGNVTTWQIEGASVSSYEVRKFPKETLAPGIQISITAYPAKNGENVADGATVTLPDGKRVFFGGSGPIDGLDVDGKPCLFGKDPACL